MLSLLGSHGDYRYVVYPELLNNLKVKVTHIRNYFKRSNTLTQIVKSIAPQLVVH